MFPIKTFVTTFALKLAIEQSDTIRCIDQFWRKKFIMIYCQEGGYQDSAMLLILNYLSFLAKEFESEFSGFVYTNCFLKRNLFSSYRQEIEKWFHFFAFLILVERLWTLIGDVGWRLMMACYWTSVTEPKKDERIACVKAACQCPKPRQTFWPQNNNGRELNNKWSTSNVRIPIRKTECESRRLRFVGCMRQTIWLKYRHKWIRKIELLWQTNFDQ